MLREDWPSKLTGRVIGLSMRFTLSLGVAALGLAALMAAVVPAIAAAPPSQPAEGPGGVGDRAATVVKRGLGKADEQVYATLVDRRRRRGRGPRCRPGGWGAERGRGDGGSCAEP